MVALGYHLPRTQPTWYCAPMANRTNHPMSRPTRVEQACQFNGWAVLVFGSLASLFMIFANVYRDEDNAAIADVGAVLLVPTILGTVGVGLGFLCVATALRYLRLQTMLLDLAADADR